MTCEKAREIFPELLDPRTPATAQLEARTHLASCPDCQRDFAALTQTATALDAMPTPPPSPRLRRNFYAMLEEEKHSAASVRAVARREHRVSLLRWVLSPLAAAALLALGFVVGQRNAQRASSQELATSDAIRTALRSELLAVRDQVAKQNEQMERMTKAVLVSAVLQQQQQSPANSRLSDILAKVKQENVDDKTLEQLVLAVTLDPNANVRLRALDALYAHADRQMVRAGVLTALQREPNPLVQLELIDFIATAQDPNAAPVLEQISADESANANVRDAAKFALAQL
jgi:hypothetical protein